MAPQALKSKSGQNNPKNSTKNFIEIGSSHCKTIPVEKTGFSGCFRRGFSFYTIYQIMIISAQRILPRTEVWSLQQTHRVCKIEDEGPQLKDARNC